MNHADPSLLELFRAEAETHASTLSEGLVEMEASPKREHFEPLMRAAHSIKGAARIMGLNILVSVSHALEDSLSAAQFGKLEVGPEHVDLFLKVVDLLHEVAGLDDETLFSLEELRGAEIRTLEGEIRALLGVEEPVPTTPSRIEAVMPAASGQSEVIGEAPISSEAPAPIEVPTEVPTDMRASTEVPVPIEAPASPSLEATLSVPVPDARIEPAVEEAQTATKTPEAKATPRQPTPAPAPDQHDESNRVVRMTADNLTRLLGLAGETLVASRALRPFCDSLLRLKRLHTRLATEAEAYRRDLARSSGGEWSTRQRLDDSLRILDTCRDMIADLAVGLDQFDRRSSFLAQRLYREVVASRMRPFSDGCAGLQRMVRDVARDLGRKARLEIRGEKTRVDRDILERLEAPLGHLLRNAVDHGVEDPVQREAHGKSVTGSIVLEARHRRGMLTVTISDDGDGIDFEAIRRRVVERGLASAEVAGSLSQDELAEFLFLPGFSVRDEVTEVSGRGVGLDVVRETIASVHGTIHVHSQRGEGTSFELMLPLTLSVMRCLIVNIGGQPYALPLSRIDRAMHRRPKEVRTLEGLPYLRDDGDDIGLLRADELLELGSEERMDDGLAIVLLSQQDRRFGLIVDEFLGERELVVQPLDPRLGKVQDVSAAAVLDDGSSVVILDVDDLIQSMERTISEGRVGGTRLLDEEASIERCRRILVVDDSLTVREVERKLLVGHGYEVNVAVNGQDAWNAVRSQAYDLVISDVDMPRMNGIELVKTIRGDPNLRHLPILVVSYKDREGDRMRGLEAGANRYLAKGSFHEDALIEAVVDLIGKAQE